MSFGYADFYAKIFLILFNPFENSTTRIAILDTLTFELENLIDGVSNGDEEALFPLLSTLS